eukprot:3495161-Alexandrium_andersonii.AAC.1
MHELKLDADESGCAVVHSINGAGSSDALVTSPAKTDTSSTTPPPPGKKRARDYGEEKYQGKPKMTNIFNRRCKGCHMYFSADGMAGNQCYCHKDKLVMDSIYRIAKAQNNLE